MSHTPMVESLLRPEAYPVSECPEMVSLKETHVSWLFLTGRFVYKIKKPVNYEFLDFSTIEKRRFYCQEELRLNRQFSPNIYLNVVEIQQKGDDFFFGAGDTIVDYAVKMRQLPEDKWLSRLIEENRVDLGTIEKIALHIAEMHLWAETNSRMAGYGSPESLRFNTNENFTQTRNYVGRLIAQSVYDVVRAYTEIFLEVNQGMFEHRQEAGYIRQCHGDLRLDQINVDHKIEIIDCIEFNERFRYSDVAADLAYLAMDLDSVYRSNLSEKLVDSYIHLTQDYELRSLLNYYKCYRAYTRGKVICFQLENSDGGTGDRRMLEQRALRYMELAKSYSIPEGPILIITTGLMGSGKSTLAEELGQRLDARVFSSDILRKEIAGISPQTHVRTQWDTGIYSQSYTRTTYELLHQLARKELAEKGIVILDASYVDPQWREQAYQIAMDCGAVFLVLETVCPDQTIRERLQERENARSGPSDGRLEILDRQKRQFRNSSRDSTAEHILIDTSKSLTEVVNRALRGIYLNIFAPSSSRELTSSEPHKI